MSTGSIHQFLVSFLIFCEGISLHAGEDSTPISNSIHHSSSTRNVYNVKLSPVPLFEVDTPSVGNNGGQYEVLLAPAAPSNHFILQPIQPGSNRPSTGSYQTPLASFGPYYIDQQGNLMQRPGSTKPLNFHEAPPAFPLLTDDQLTMLGQPLASHHNQDGGHPNPSGSFGTPHVTEDQKPQHLLPGSSPLPSSGSSTFPVSGGSPYLMSPAPAFSPTNKPPLTTYIQNGQSTYTQSSPFQNEPTTQQYAPQESSHPVQYSTSTFRPSPVGKPPLNSGQPYKPSQQVQFSQHHQIPTEPPSSSASHQPPNTYRPSSTNVVPLPPQPSTITSNYGGTYIATINRGLGRHSDIFTCFQTHLLDKVVLTSGEYLPGPRGYSCKTSKGRPFLSNHLLAANSRSPVLQPIVSSEPALLPTVIPIKFV